MSKNGIQTLYIRNLNEKISLKKLKRGLLALFENKGLDVVEFRAYGNRRLKGQAFVTLKNAKLAQTAIQILNMYVLYDQMMEVTLAKNNSDKALQIGNVKVDMDVIRLKRQDRRNEMKNRAQKRKTEDSGDTRNGNKHKRPRNDGLEPNKILLFTDLPHDITTDELNEIFNKFKGFLNVTHVLVKNLALVEFKTETDSIYCLGHLGKSPVVNGKTCELVFAKK